MQFFDQPENKRKNQAKNGLKKLQHTHTHTYIDNNNDKLKKN